MLTVDQEQRLEALHTALGARLRAFQTLVGRVTRPEDLEALERDLENVLEELRVILKLYKV